MGICSLLYQLCKSLGRFQRFFCKNKEIIRSNSNSVDVTDKVTSIATWNTQCLFLYMNSQKIKNIIYELKLLEFNDVLCLQEVFDDTMKYKIIDELSNIYPYYLLGNTDKKYRLGDDSGLLVLSKFKVKYCKEVILDGATFPDNLSNKSILYFSVGNLNMVNTHLQSSDLYNSSNVTIKQINDIIKYSPFERFIIIGDLNNSEAHIHVGVPKNNDQPTCDNSILDYILPIHYPCISIDSYISSRSIKNISDHKCLLSKINYT